MELLFFLVVITLIIYNRGNKVEEDEDEHIKGGYSDNDEFFMPGGLSYRNKRR